MLIIIFQVVEVKGPGDRLSQKQILWIDYLLSHGVDTEVCHVQGNGLYSFIQSLACFDIKISFKVDFSKCIESLFI